MIGASRGYAVKVCLPKNASPGRKRILRSYGVEIVETDPMLSTDGAQLIAREIFVENPANYFYPDQYNNDANWLAHYETTANEIWEQTEFGVTHFVTGLGTSGTFVGVTRRLRELNPRLSTDGAQLIAREIFAEDPEKYFYPDQYNNEANWLAHYETTANEIWEQTEGRITHFVTGLGTSGTFVGVTRRLRELNRGLEAIAVQPESPLHGLEGLKHFPTAITPGIFDESLVTETLEVSTEDALLMTSKLARQEGLLVGPSSGANVFAAWRVAAALREPAVVVTVLCDGGERYLND